MPNYEVHFHPLAQHDLLGILDFFAGQNLNTSRKFSRRLSTKLKQLERFPLLGPVVQNARYARRGLRYLVIDDYMAIYAVENQIVLIYRITHGARDFSHLLD